VIDASPVRYVRTSAAVSFEDRDEHELKGVWEPVRVFCVKEQGTGNQEEG
jgi:hypothetical protein